MLGTTLSDLRGRIERLASPAGEYTLVCARYGDRPVPATRLRFETRETARAAARATERYRASLRRYDPRLPWYDVIVCQGELPESAEPACPSPTESAEATPSDAWTLSDPVCTNRHSSRRDLVEYCHSVAAAVFEALSDGGYGAVESAVLDNYLDLAEAVSDPDECCLRLLETMAVEIAARLSPADQSRILSRAARRLEPVESGAEPEPIEATLGFLRGLGVLDEFSRTPWPIPSGCDTPAATVSVSGYAFTPLADRLPTLPIVVDLYRRPLEWVPRGLYVREDGSDWQLHFILSRRPVSGAIVSAPAISE